MPARIAVFASGAGSNLEALLRHLTGTGATVHPAGSVVLVASNRPSAGALATGARSGATAAILSDPTDGAAVAALLERHRVDLVVLAGYLRAVPPGVIAAWRGRVLNVHPALLPAFGGPGMYGSRVHQAVLDAGVRVTGVTIHFVDEIYDHGPIIAQWPVPVLATDTGATLADRVLRVEHQLYPRVVESVAAGQIHLDPHGRVQGALGSAGGLTTFALSRDEVIRPWR